MVDFSATRNTTKLAGTKDIATIMNMAITTSVPCNLKKDSIEVKRMRDGNKISVIHMVQQYVQVVQRQAGTGLVHWVVCDGYT